MASRRTLTTPPSGKAAVEAGLKTGSRRDDDQDDPSLSRNTSSTSKEESHHRGRSSYSKRTTQRHLQTLFRASLCMRLFSITALIICTLSQQAFDTSPTLLWYSLDPFNQLGLQSSSKYLLKSLLAFVRWDTVYFLSIASPHSSGAHVGGYASEQMLAFQPGIVILLRLAGYITPSMDGRWNPASSILVTTLLANIATLVSPILFYKLTVKVLSNQRTKTTVTHSNDQKEERRHTFAYVAALQSILAPAAGTSLTCPTPEPFFSLSCLLGLLALESDRKASAVLWFAVATLFRANGLLLVGFLAWKLLFVPAAGFEARSQSTKLLFRRILVALAKLAALCLVTSAPFVTFQYWAHQRFCTSLASGQPIEGGARPWCSDHFLLSLLPIPATTPTTTTTTTSKTAYAFVQSHYWNVGLFRYWEIAQLPNFLLAMPIITLIWFGAYAYTRRSTFEDILAAVTPFQVGLNQGTVKKSAATNTHDLQENEKFTDSESSPFSLRASPDMVPYMVYTLLLSLILVLASHVQIVLRLASAGSMPFVWWTAAHICLSCSQSHKSDGWKKVVVGYLSIQSVVGIVLYSGFYPPA